LINLPNTPERWTTLRDELIQSYTITDQQLTQLADQRAKNARRVFLKKTPDMADRLSIGDVQAIQAETAGVGLGVSLVK
jgi:hypothetical protein